MFPRRQNIRPRILGTLVFLGALLLLVNGTIIYSIRTSQRLLDQELGKRLQGTAHIAALLVQPAQFEMLALAVADTAAAADTALTDFSMAMDAQEAADAVKAEWKRLAASAGLSNVILVDPSRRVLLRLRDPFAFEPDVVVLDRVPLTRALIGATSHSSLYYKDGQYLRSGYAPVTGPDGAVLGAVAVEGGSEAFLPLQVIRTSLYGAAIVASLLVIVIGIGYGRTVGHLLRIEENLRHTDLLASIGQVSAGVAHEIRNPLAVLRGASSRLQKYEQLPSKERTQLLNMIDEEVGRMSAFVQNFLHLSRRPNLEPQEFELRQVLERSLGILRVEMDRSGVVMSVEWKAPDGVSLVGDPLAMHHVFLNLALNARDVMPNGGKLAIRVFERRGEVRIQFEDTGPGVPRDIRKQVFDAFFTTRAKGTGLGLAFVDRIVSEHGGSVTVGDAPTGGALFEIRIPLEGA
ncbi:MAG TPA: ATP-binding protein [Candidatus Dormibacteraeota bacterium]|nr:ATP-binding protein [Candidatus Dormibacteraeota bacterium]